MTLLLREGADRGVMADAGAGSKGRGRTPNATTLDGFIEPMRTRDGRKPGPRGDETRARIIREAAACVLDEGFAAASANRIALRSGVTWGVIQYHFGDRAGLFSAVTEAGYEEFRGIIEDAGVPDGDTRARVRAIVDTGWHAFSTPLGRASIEILVNTRASRSHDPAHARHLVEMARGLHRLIDEAFPPVRGERPVAVRNVLWAALRGFALAQMMSPTDTDFAHERDVLVDLVAGYLDASSTAAATSTPATRAPAATRTTPDPSTRPRRAARRRPTTTDEGTAP